MRYKYRYKHTNINIETKIQIQIHRRKIKCTRLQILNFLVFELFLETICFNVEWIGNPRIERKCETKLRGTNGAPTVTIATTLTNRSKFPQTKFEIIGSCLFKKKKKLELIKLIINWLWLYIYIIY